MSRPKRTQPQHLLPFSVSNLCQILVNSYPCARYTPCFDAQLFGYKVRLSQELYRMQAKGPQTGHFLATRHAFMACVPHGKFADLFSKRHFGKVS